jgi:lipoyl synthase
VSTPVRVRHLGRVPYQEARDLQSALKDSEEDYLLILEHPAVITLGLHAESSHVLVDPQEIGAELIATDRGGDVTLHAPGQVVAYPIISIDIDPKSVTQHVANMEQAVIETVGRYVDEQVVGGIGRLQGYPGVWVGIDTASPAKIAAIGVRNTRHGSYRRTEHGLALNVATNLSLFDAIVPCGIPDKSVTSLQALGADVDVREVAEVLAEVLAEQLFPGREVEVVSTEPRVARDEVRITQESMSRRRLRGAGVDPDQGLQISQRKPDWLRVQMKLGEQFAATKSVVSDLGLVTVCEEAGCPNISECWADGTATFMVNGERCTRACGFCLVDTRHPLALDPTEPDRVAEAVTRMRLGHAVITCVARDDLADGGAGAIASTIHAIRARQPETQVEVLISDCKGDVASQQLIFDARPDVLNHNIETVARLQRAVRPSAGYARSLTVLARAVAQGLTAKSGLMLGLGETDEEVVETLRDLASVGVSIVTIGQYLRPTAKHLPVARYAEPQVFERLADIGRSFGIAHVQSSPLTRSSYHAREASETASGVAVVLRTR